MSSSKSCLGTISTSPTLGIFWVLHNGGCINSSTGSVNQLTSSLFIPHLKLKNLFNVKDPLSDRPRTRIAYKFSCASCNACYVGETIRHFPKLVHEHTSSDRSFHVYKHLQVSESCCTSRNLDCFKILDSAPTRYQVKLKESMYIKWEKPDLNQQVKHIHLMLSL